MNRKDINRTDPPEFAPNLVKFQDYIYCRLEVLENRISSIDKIIPPELIFFNNKEFCEIVGCSERHARELRDEGLIAFSQPTRKMIRYKASDIKAFLESNYQEAINL